MSEAKSAHGADAACQSVASVTFKTTENTLSSSVEAAFPAAKCLGKSIPGEGIMGRGWHAPWNHRGQRSRAPQPMAHFFPLKGVPIHKAGREASALSDPRWQKEGPPAQQTSRLNQSVAEQHGFDFIPGA